MIRLLLLLSSGGVAEREYSRAFVRQTLGLVFFPEFFRPAGWAAEMVRGIAEIIILKRVLQLGFEDVVACERFVLRAKKFRKGAGRVDRGQEVDPVLRARTIGFEPCPAVRKIFEGEDFRSILGGEVAELRGAIGIKPRKFARTIDRDHVAQDRGIARSEALVFRHPFDPGFGEKLRVARDRKITIVRDSGNRENEEWDGNQECAKTLHAKLPPVVSFSE